MSDDTLPGANAVLVRMSPELAEEWLSRNRHNRTISQAVVAQYAADMKAGNWRFTGQPLIVDTAKELLDGQHRLTAQVRANVTLYWLVVTDASTEVRDYIDIGRGRTVGNQLQIKGAHDGYAIAAIARLDLIYSGQSKPSKPMVREHAEANMDAFYDAAKVARSASQMIHGPSAAYGVAFYRLFELGPERTSVFFDALRTGAGLTATSPILIARNHIMRTATGRVRVSPTDSQRCGFVDYLFRAWNLWVTGRQIKSFGVPTCQVIPVTPKRVIKAVA